MMSWHFIALVAAVLVTTVGQLLLKHGVSGNSRYHIGPVKAAVAAALGLFLLVTILNIYALKAIELKFFTAFTAINYLLTSLAASVFLRERLQRIHIFGCVLVVAGMVVFSI